MKYNRLTVLKEIRSKNKKTLWLCKCDCGSLKKLRKTEVKTGRVKSCGCLLREKMDLTNKKFGKLLVLKEVKSVHFNKKTNKANRRWQVRCECLHVYEIDQLHLTRKNGNTKSCGCVKKQKKFLTKNLNHYRRLYSLWHTMKRRCFVKTSGDYNKYGGRGITVCKRWLDFSLFYNDVIDTYKPGLTIERINVNGNYEPKNCIWIKNQEQAKNRRTTVWIDGLCAKDFCKKYNVKYHKYTQFRKLGLSIDDIKNKLLSLG